MRNNWDNRSEINSSMVINLHLLDACNYICKHCFAHFNAPKLLTLSEWKAIIDNIIRDTKVSRFNLAGGEPLLYPHIDQLIQYISNLGIECSIITNGFFLTEENINSYKGKVSMIGLSIDSLDTETLRKIGRCNKKGDVFDNEKCRKICECIKAAGIKLKINTLVTVDNKDEDFSGFISQICPDRWKILKMKYFENASFSNMTVQPEDDDYEIFIDRHKHLPHVQERQMANAYFMVDAFGNLIDTGTYDNTPLGSLLSESYKTLFNKMNINQDIYNLRYAA